MKVVGVDELVGWLVGCWSESRVIELLRERDKRKKKKKKKGERRPPFIEKKVVNVCGHMGHERILNSGLD